MKTGSERRVWVSGERGGVACVPASCSARSLGVGRFMQRMVGMNSMKIRLTHGAIVCVAGDRKWTLRTPTVTQMEKVTRIIVKSRYLPRRGTAREVGGMISASSKKNTVSATRIEIERVTCRKGGENGERKEVREKEEQIES